MSSPREPAAELGRSAKGGEAHESRRPWTERSLVCGSGKKYKKCCYPRTLPDFSKPNAGLPDPFEEREATYRALSRQEAHPPQDDNVTIDSVDVGRTRLLSAPLTPYGEGVALPGTLAPPTPLQVEAKYKEIRARNPEGVTEVVVTCTHPEMFGFAEVRAVFDADENFRLVDGRVVSVPDLFRGKHVWMADGTIGTIKGNPERRSEIPVPPLPDENGLWTSRVMGRVKHTAHEIVEFRWGGQMVRVTPGHAVWSASRRGWVGAHELYRGEMIRVTGNVVAPVEGVRRVTGRIEVFGIEVEYFHNYFVGAGDNAMLVHNGPECLVRPMEAEAAAQLPETVLFRVARGDAKGRAFGTPRNPRAPTVEEFNPRIGEVRAGDLAETIVGRKHGIFPEQAQRVGQLSHEELIRFRVEDPISATQAQNGLSLTGGHHRTNEIIQRVQAGQLEPNTIILHD